VSRRELLAVLRAHGPATAAELGAVLGWSRQRTVRRLQRLDVAVVVTGSRPTGGRPAAVWAVRP
jgi:predicted ArsR family transcriptional regulator